MVWGQPHRMASHPSFICLLCCIFSLLQHCIAYTVVLSDANIHLLESGPKVLETVHHRRLSRSEHTESIYNETIQDNHDYYTSQSFGTSDRSRALWVNLDDPMITAEVQAPESLATNGNSGMTVALNFRFPFYGHDVTSFVITTGGFIYAGSYIHKYLAATQYIAPLMGNFCPSETDSNAGVRYYSNETSITVEWTNQNLADNRNAGIFTFQATLFDDGRIIFAYKEIPVPVSSISEQEHPVKVGIADAYYIDEVIGPFTKKREIFEYHQVHLNVSQVKNDSAVLITPLPTCNLFTTCETCASSQVAFNCTWCEKLGRCSDGLDRHRQRWLESECDKTDNFVNDVTQCPGYTTLPPSKGTPSVQELLSTEVTSTGQKLPIETDQPEQPDTIPGDYCIDIECQNSGTCVDGFCNCPTNFAGARCQKFVIRHCEKIICKNGGRCVEGITTHFCDCLPGFTGPHCSVGSQTSGQGLTVGAMVCIILIGLLVCGLLVWAVYAYRHPTSPSGLFIIEAKHKLKGRSRGANGVKYKYHQQMDSNHVDIQL